MCEFTIVTCLYDIRKKESSTFQNVSTMNDYLELSKSMLSIQLPMVIYTDDEMIVEHVYKTRLNYGLIEKTLIIRLPFEQTFFYKDLDVLLLRMKTFHIVNRNNNKDTPLYTLLNNNKFDFLERTIHLNPFKTDFFLWMDMGIQHCTNANETDWLEVSQSWKSFICWDKQHIHQLRIHTVLKPIDMLWKDYFKTIYHHVAGGLFGGYKDRLMEYSQLFKEHWYTILYKEEWWQLDEAIMTMITEKYPEKFRFFYGDYDGLLTNFIRTKKSFYLVFQTAQRYIENKQYTLAQKVLDTIEIECLDREYYQQYIEMRLRLIST